MTLQKIVYGGIAKESEDREFFGCLLLVIYSIVSISVSPKPGKSQS